MTLPCRPFSAAMTCACGMHTSPSLRVGLTLKSLLAALSPIELPTTLARTGLNTSHPIFHRIRSGSPIVHFRTGQSRDPSGLPCDFNFQVSPSDGISDVLDLIARLHIRVDGQASSGTSDATNV